MKTKLLIISIISMSFLNCYAQKSEQSEKYYYYNGEKKYLKVNKSKFTLYFEDEISDTESFVTKKYKSSIKINSHKKSIAAEMSLLDPKDYKKEISSLKKDKRIKAIELVIGDSITVPVSNNFYV